MPRKPKLPAPVPVPEPITVPNLWIDGKTNILYSTMTISNPSGHGVSIIRSSNITLQNLLVQNCLLSGIREYGNSNNNIINCTLIGNGKDGAEYNGDGLLIQGLRTLVSGLTITNNGDDPTFEHGIYAASVARDYLIENCVLKDNAASGIKASGGGTVWGNTITGSPRGIVFADDVDAQISVLNNKISAVIPPAVALKYPTWKPHVILVTANCRLARYTSDYNIFASGSRFGYLGQSLDLAGWQQQTGLDLHSVYGEV
jgi:parallel beta-helix repeat protein